MNQQFVYIFIFWIASSTLCSASQECTLMLENNQQIKGIIERPLNIYAAFGTCRVDPKAANILRGLSMIPFIC